MEKTNNKKKKIITIVISIIIILALGLAISYAYFSTQLSGSDQIVKVGKLELVLDETSEGITLDNAVGISDSKGMSSTPSTFELRNNGNKAVDYTIYLDDNTISDTDTRIDDKYLKYNLNKNSTDSGATLLTRTGANPNRILDSGTIEGGGINKYSLKLWITDEVDGNYSGQVFSGKLRVEVSQEREKEVATVLLENIPKENQYNDGTDTFITGEDPDNYIWYSGKLWRAVLVNNEEKTVKLVTQDNISAISYDDDSSAFAGSHMEEWLNDITVDGFLGNLRDYENFIVTDAEWDATMDDTVGASNVTRPDRTTIVTDAVGLLNAYEYIKSYRGTGYSNGYLNNGLFWWTLTPNTSSTGWAVGYLGDPGRGHKTSNAYGIRPSVNLKASVKIVKGKGTIDNPYRLEGDNDTNMLGTPINTRYSGEYIIFGKGENNLYRIVSHETEGLTKIASASSLKDSDTTKHIAFDSTNKNVNYSSTNTIGTFLNGEYLINYVGEKNSNMVEDNTTWYLGAVEDGESYKLAKYTDTTNNIFTSNTTNAKVGLLRYGELMNISSGGVWTLTPILTTSKVWVNTWTGGTEGCTTLNNAWAYGVIPSMNLKSNVIITSGDGTLQNPFTIELAD